MLPVFVTLEIVREAVRFAEEARSSDRKATADLIEKREFYSCAKPRHFFI
jgi:hypothetical protein